MKAIITFHSIDSTGSVLSYSPAMFADLIRTFVNSPLQLCDLDTLLDPKTQHGLTLTFDDGIASVFTRALPILKLYSVPAHLFLTTGPLGIGSQWPKKSFNEPQFTMLNWQQVETCHSNGIHIESHTKTHPDLRRLSDSEIEAEFAGADEIITFRLGRRPSYFAYPYGYFDMRVRRLAAKRYRACMTTKLKPLSTLDNVSALPRIDAYYLRAPWLYQRLETMPARVYLAVRSILRTLRGSQ